MSASSGPAFFQNRRIRIYPKMKATTRTVATTGARARVSITCDLFRERTERSYHGGPHPWPLSHRTPARPGEGGRMQAAAAGSVPRSQGQVPPLPGDGCAMGEG